MKDTDTENNVGRAVSALIGDTAAVLTTALTHKLLGQPKATQRKKRQPARPRRTQSTTAAMAGKEVRHA